MKMGKKRLFKPFRFRHKITKPKECRCLLCTERIDKEEFRNAVFKREFENTGLCQGCLDFVFGYKIAW